MLGRSLFLTSLWRWVTGWRAEHRQDRPAPLEIEVERKDQCVFCLGWHARYCGRVKSLIFDSQGQPKQVEHWADEEWDQSRVIFLDTDTIEGEQVLVKVKEAVS